MGQLVNHRRVLEPIGNIPPADAENQYYAVTDDIELAAKLTIHGLRQTQRGSSFTFAFRLSSPDRENLSIGA